MTKVLVATEKPFAAAAVKSIKEVLDNAGFEMVLLENYTDQADFIKAIADVDACIIRSDKATKEVLDAAKNLKIIVRAGAGYDNIDLAAATANNVVAMNTPGQNSNAVAELAFGMAIFMARGFYSGKSGTELREKTLGIHAFGNIGQYMAKIAQGFGMKVSAFDPFKTKAEIEAAGITAVGSVEELYANNQYVSVNIPATEQTKKSLNFELLSKMPKGATLINTARKEVILEDDLVKVFEARPDFKYVADVAPDNLAVLQEKFGDRIFCTPKKIGAQTSEANNNAGIAAANQIVSFIKDGVTKFRVN